MSEILINKLLQEKIYLDSIGDSYRRIKEISPSDALEYLKTWIKFSDAPKDYIDLFLTDLGVEI